MTQEEKKKPVDIVKWNAKEHWTEMGLVVCFMVQKLQKPTLTELKEQIKEKLSVQVHPATLKRVCEGAKKGGFITLSMELQESGVSERCAHVKSLNFRNAPEYMHISDFLPALMKTDQATAVKAWFDHQEGTGDKKKRNGSTIGAVYGFVLEGVLLTPIIGSQIRCQQTENIRKDHKGVEPTVNLGTKKKKGKEEANEVEVAGIFNRCSITGAYVIPTDVLRGWFRTNICGPMTNLPQYFAEKVGFSEVYIVPEKPVTQLVLPVQGRQGAAEPKAYECIAAGERIKLVFRAPVRGGLTPEQYEKAMLLAAVQPTRGLSPARGTRYGKFLPTSFKCLGPVNPADVFKPKTNGTNGNGSFRTNTGVEAADLIELILAGVPEPILDSFGEYALEAADRLRHVDFGRQHEGEEVTEAFPAQA